MKTGIYIVLGLILVGGLGYLVLKPKDGKQIPAAPAGVTKDAILAARPSNFKTSQETNASPQYVPSWHPEFGDGRTPRERVSPSQFEAYVAATAAAIAKNPEWQANIIKQTETPGYAESGLDPLPAMYVNARTVTAGKFFYQA